MTGTSGAALPFNCHQVFVKQEHQNEFLNIERRKQAALHWPVPGACSALLFRSEATFYVLLISNFSVGNRYVIKLEAAIN